MKQWMRLHVNRSPADAQLTPLPWFERDVFCCRFVGAQRANYKLHKHPAVLKGSKDKNTVPTIPRSHDGRARGIFKMEGSKKQFNQFKEQIERERRDCCGTQWVELSSRASGGTVPSSESGHGCSQLFLSFPPQRWIIIIRLIKLFGVKLPLQAQSFSPHMRASHQDLHVFFFFLGNVFFVVVFSGI